MRNRVALVAVCVLVAGSLAVAYGADAVAGNGEAVTFNEHIGPIIHNRCASCHRPGQAGPFSLLAYEDVAKRAPLIRAVTQSRYMPPWHAESGYGSFKEERRMLDAEMELVARWVDSGAPEVTSPPPVPPEFSSDWTLGTPDVVVEMEAPYTVPAAGPDIYRNFPARARGSDFAARTRLAHRGERKPPVRGRGCSVRDSLCGVRRGRRCMEARALGRRRARRAARAVHDTARRSRTG